jgi:hypothetical protein
MRNSQGFGLEIIVDGRPLQEFGHEGKTYFPAEVGKEFALRVIVPYGRRFEAVTSVDGLDVLTGKLASTTNSGYVITNSADIRGFRLNDDEVARFEFLPKGGSYAKLTSRPANVGVIGLVLFAEYQRPVLSRRRFEDFGFESLERGGGAHTYGGATRGSAKGGLEHSVGAGFGARTEDHVERVHFVRGTEAARIVLEYDTREKLIEAGIIKEPAFAAVDAFPGDAKRAITGCLPPAGWPD